MFCEQLLLNLLLSMNKKDARCIWNGVSFKSGIFRGNISAKSIKSSHLSYSVLLFEWLTLDGHRYNGGFLFIQKFLFAFKFVSHVHVLYDSVPMICDKCEGQAKGM